MTHTAKPSLRDAFETLKTAHPGALIGFEMGSFVEFFFEDAHTIADTLGIVLTKRGKHSGQPIPMAGLPIPFDRYLPRLNAAGLTLVIDREWSGSAGPPMKGDVEPIDVSTLSPNQQRRITEEMWALERERLRAASLHERLSKHGLAKEADTLHVKWLYGNIGDKAARLDAIEKIVARLEGGATADLLVSLRTGAGTSAALRLLAQVQSPHTQAALGERIAVAVICKSDDEGLAFNLSGDVAGRVRETIEDAADSLRRRLALAEDALERLSAAGVGRTGPLQ